MLTIARLFGKSPFEPLQLHMQKVEACVDKLKSLFDTFETASLDELVALAKEVSKLEYEADLTKNDLRNHLPKTLFLPIDRIDLLEILHIQDSIADIAQQIAITMTMRKLELHDDFKDLFHELCAKTLETFSRSNEVIREMNLLIESSFGGLEAQKVKAMVEEVALLEHQTGGIKRKLVKHLYQEADQFKHYIFYLWLNLFEEISRLAKLSEKLAGRIRMILDVS